MERMMAAFHLDCEAIERGAPGTLRDIEITCGCCSAKKRCSRELAAGSAARNAGRFCPNADILGALGRH
jgi:hypothetical protein